MSNEKKFTIHDLDDTFNPDQKNQTDNLNINSFNSVSFEDLNNKYSETQILINPIHHEYDSIEEIIDKGGYNFMTFKIIIITSVMIIADGFYLSYFNNMLNPFKNYYNITSDVAIQFIAGLNFLGMGIGSLISGFLTRSFSRITLIYFSCFSILAFHLCLSLIDNVYIFSISRLIIAIFLGLFLILQLSILTEYLPVFFRPFVLNVIWIFWAIGAIYFLLMCKIYIPSLEYDKTKPIDDQNFHKAILQFHYVLILLILLVIFFLKDSPRNLIINNEIDKAKEILNYYTNNKITEENIENIRVRLLTAGENQFYDKEKGIRELFKPRIRNFMILMMTAFFFISFGFYGLNGTTAGIIKNINEQIYLKFGEKKETVDGLILIFIISCIGNIIGGVFSEIKHFGRKNSEIFFFSISTLCAILALIFLKSANILLAFSLSFYGASFNMHITYSEEIFPTKIRDFAMGLLFFMTRMGGFTCQFIFIPMLKFNPLFPVYIYIGITLILIVILFFLPHDNDNELDSVIEIGNVTNEEKQK